MNENGNILKSSLTCGDSSFTKNEYIFNYNYIL